VALFLCDEPTGGRGADEDMAAIHMTMLRELHGAQVD